MKTINNIEQLFAIIIFFVIAIACVVIFIAIFRMIQDLNAVLSIKHPQKYQKRDLSLTSIWQRLNRSVAIEEEESIIMHHSYDGIRELDNHLPPWWTATFVLSVIFGIIYLSIYHVWEKAPLQIDEYSQEMQTSKNEVDAYLAKNTAKIDENSVKKISTAEEIENGKNIYSTNCLACHGDAGQGMIGPNLTDNYWLHGDGSIEAIFKVIKNGVPEKGMISWKATLKPDQIQAVSNFILSLNGTKSANAKEPQGTEVHVVAPSI